MSPDPTVTESSASDVALPVAAAAPWWSDRRLQALAVIAALALGSSLVLWQKVSGMQQQLARQSEDAGNTAAEARTQARQAVETATQTAAKLAVTDAKLAEVALQRSQLEELMQSLSRSRDENLVVDIESALRLAQQQAQLTGSVEPLLAALRAAEVRIGRTAQPRLAPVQRAIARDLAKVKSSVVADTPALLIKLDELVLLADELPLANAVGAHRDTTATKRQPDEPLMQWSWRWLQALQDEVRTLVRVSRIDAPEASLVAPEQAFFLRENLKLRLLNARLGLVSRQLDSARSDLATASTAITRYFDPAARKTQTATALAQQVMGQMKVMELPRVDDTLAALATAAAGR
ncbi:uroporphyrinogen-III C-methyltransferase [Curvibacter sp. APW13]|uniref:uroporphyrinogen-III C-methyltransferase n=1 Tax=Curvibacter sp. APW13 TaxID=3077236 RepID=UPI0028DDEA51|nr:uroporphyrinogen-III C-methyltransferase [Curvibacter sp. APW13]MDT8990910.1 uroporphyrinogen-III C-methyltransferase [Curvibacter sp. APW13]